MRARLLWCCGVPISVIVSQANSEGLSEKTYLENNLRADVKKENLNDTTFKSSSKWKVRKSYDAILSTWRGVEE